MSKTKHIVDVKRQNIRMDMTAMCDVGFLLLTFFILTAKFRPNEPVKVDIPMSGAVTNIPAKDILLISIGDDGRIFMGVDDKPTRSAMLDEVSRRYNFTIDGNMQKRFNNMDQFGVPLEQLPALLKLTPEETNSFVQPGLKCNPDAKILPGQTGSDTAKNQLGELIVIARSLNDRLVIAVKADKGANYDKVDAVIETLRKTNSNRFNLVTSVKNEKE